MKKHQCYFRIGFALCAPVILPAVDVSGLKSEPYNKSPFNKTFRCLTMHPLFYMSFVARNTAYNLLSWHQKNETTNSPIHK